MSGLSSAAAAGTGGSKLGSSKLLVAGLAGVGVAAGAGLIYYGYLKPKAAKKRQEELNKKFESSGKTFVDHDLVGKKTAEKPKVQPGTSAKTDKDKDSKENAAVEAGVVDEHAGLHQERSVCRDIVIPRGMASSFIGTNGAYVRKLQSDTKTRISSKETLENGDRVYSISGLSHDVALAEHEVERFIALQPVYTTLEIMVPNEYVGSIIGTKGETIRSLQDRTKAKIQVDPHQDPEVAFFAPSTTARTTTPVLIKGTEKQIAHAKELIEDIINRRMAADQRNANNSTRPNRRVLKSSSPARSGALVVTTGEKEQITSHIKADGTLSIYVTCVFDPNNFYIQVFNSKTSAQLNRLTEDMSEYYQNVPPQSGGADFKFKVGDIVAATWELDTKVHRAQIIGMKDNGDRFEVQYVDYGDKRILPPSSLREMKTEFLRLRFQALQATINTPVPKGGWTDTIVDEFCNLTFAGNWTQITAKRVDFLANSNVNDDKICVELFYITKHNTININEELRRFISALESAPQQQTSRPQLEVNAAHVAAAEASPPNAETAQIPAPQGAGDFDATTFGMNGSYSASESSSDKTGLSTAATHGSKSSSSDTLSISSTSPSTPEKTSESVVASSPSPTDAFPQLTEEAPLPSVTSAPPPFSYAAMARKKSSS